MLSIHVANLNSEQEIHPAP